MTFKSRLGFSNVGPLGETFSPPFIILGYGMELRKMEGDSAKRSGLFKLTVIVRSFAASTRNNVSQISPRIFCLDFALAAQPNFRPPTFSDRRSASRI